MYRRDDRSDRRDFRDQPPRDDRRDPYYERRDPYYERRDPYYERRDPYYDRREVYSSCFYVCPIVHHPSISLSFGNNNIFPAELRRLRPARLS